MKNDPNLIFHKLKDFLQKLVQKIKKSCASNKVAVKFKGRCNQLQEQTAQNKQKYTKMMQVKDEHRTRCEEKRTKVRKMDLPFKPNWSCTWTAQMFGKCAWFWSKKTRLTERVKKKEREKMHQKDEEQLLGKSRSLVVCTNQIKKK